MKFNFVCRFVSPSKHCQGHRFFLGLNNTNIRVKLIHEIALKLLDAFYLKRGPILEQICRSAIKEVKQRDVAMLGADYLLLATAIILAASDVLDKEHSDLVC